MKKWINKVFGFGLASFLSDFSHEMTVSLIPTLVAGFVGPAQAPFVLGIISSTTDAFASFLRLFSGYMSDKISHKKPLIAIGYGISAVFSTLTGFAASALQLLIFRTLSFTGSALREPPRDALIAASVEPKNYGRAFGLQRAMDTLGSLAGPLAAFVATSYFLYSSKTIFLISFIPGICATVAIIFLTQDVRFNSHKIRKYVNWHDELRLLPRIYYVIIIIFFIFDLGIINKLLLLMRAQEMLAGSVISIASIIVLLYAVFNTTRAINEFILGLLSDYVNRSILLAFFGFGLQAVVAALLMYSPIHISYTFVIFALAGISIGSASTLKKAILADVLPDEVRGLGFGLQQATEGIAALFSSTIIGYVWTHYSVRNAFLYSVTLSITAMVLLLMVLLFNQYRTRH